MLVGLGGNNGSTFVASLLANQLGLTWETREGHQQANYLGSLVMSSTMKLGTQHHSSTYSEKVEEVFIPVHRMVPMIHPSTLVVSGWDLNNANLNTAMERARVLEPDLRKQLKPYLEKIVPLPSVYYPEFIASNQEGRVNHVISGTCKQTHLEALRNDLQLFKQRNELDKVIVLWTANTEKYVDVIEGVNDTADHVLASIRSSAKDIAPSTLFAVASILEGCPFINGSPQNTLVPGVVELAERHGVHVAGDDFKSGQTKVKSVLMDYLVNAGIKPLAITSYNHLGNNDGKNLSEQNQFRSKEISKSSVVDDMIQANSILYPKGQQHIDHTVVIKYVPSVGDSKRALDEYYSEIFMGGRNTLSIVNTCEDSLLAVPLMIDLVILTELFSRVQFSKNGSTPFQSFHSVLSPLAYLLKAPMAPKNTPVINSLVRQRACLEAILRALVGLPPTNEANFEWKCFPN
ncbi:Myo-inositol-1-phosphate synthase [Coelomomyces lativittatus]|nr:Myo-inositol-1-phosphate synthase [Coelomomyces lativittatus]KAJ1503923.1 Myo-inositol-1-phosphate synthase [Coelomomyces lativittatus]KAJ1504031.1 Myo-inositol-1-phosphate synthase [Coelomomyces lativittatus]